MTMLHLPISEPKLWILDIDGVVFIHNGYLNGGDMLVPGFMDFYEKIPQTDQVLFVSARDEKYRSITEKKLRESNIRFAHIVFGVPKGERVLVNDKKPDGSVTAIAINTDRDVFPVTEVRRS